MDASPRGGRVVTAVALPAVLAAAAVVLAGAGRARPRVARLELHPSGAGLHRRPRSTGVRRSGAVLLVGAGCGALVLVGPAVWLVLVAVSAVLRLEGVRRVRQRHRRASDAAFPDLVDLFRIAAAAGHPVHRCLELVAARAPHPVRPSLVAALGRVERGIPLAEVLPELGSGLGGSGPVLTDALAAALRTGAPLGPVLDRVVEVARDRRARAAQTAARRLPVTMLFPLVCCVLPAFGLLGVVPLLAGSLGSLAP